MINKKDIKNLLLNDINDYIILLEDRSSIYSVETDFFNEYRFFDKDAQKFIDENFSKKYSNISNYNVYGLTNFEIYGSRIFIGFEKGDYKTYLATREKKYLSFIQQNNFFIIPIILNTVLITSDNKIVILKTNICEELVGGFIEQIDVKDNKIDFIQNLKRNINNIIGTAKVQNTEIIGIYKAHYSCIMVFSQNIDLSSKDIIHSGTNNKIINFINNNENDLGKIITNGCYSKHVRQAFKFFLKEKFNNYKYMNIGLL